MNGFPYTLESIYSWAAVSSRRQKMTSGLMTPTIGRDGEVLLALSSESKGGYDLKFGPCPKRIFLNSSVFVPPLRFVGIASDEPDYQTECLRHGWQGSTDLNLVRFTRSIFLLQNPSSNVLNEAASPSTLQAFLRAKQPLPMTSSHPV
jgi:hypothetical protein